MRFLIVALSLALTAAGCGNAESGNSNNTSNASTVASNNAANAPRDNEDEFELLVNLPVEPEDVVWKDAAQLDHSKANSGAANDRMVAVLRFTPERANELVSSLGAPLAPSNRSFDCENWYPAELIAQCSVSGDGKFTGEMFSAASILKPPFTDGRLTRVDKTGFFILELSAR